MRKVSVIIMCFVVCGCQEGSSDNGPSPEDEELLEQLWSDPGKADLVYFGTMYESDYTNMGLSGWASDGSDSKHFAMFAGWHTDDFPWPNAENWVSIGLKLGESGYNYVAYTRDGFSITPLTGDQEQYWELEFTGTMIESGSGTEVLVELRLYLWSHPFNRWHLGFASLGMGYRPARITQARGVTDETNTYIRIGSTTYSLDPETIIGEVEQGQVFNVNFRGAFFKYEYCSLSNPDEGRSFTSFTGKTLTEEGNFILETASKGFGKSFYPRPTSGAILVSPSTAETCLPPSDLEVQMALSGATGACCSGRVQRMA